MIEEPALDLLLLTLQCVHTHTHTRIWLILKISNIHIHIFYAHAGIFFTYLTSFQVLIICNPGDPRCMGVVLCLT